MLPERCHRGALLMVAGVLLLLAPAHAARAPLAAITVESKGSSEFNFNSGTMQLRQFVLRQPPDTLIRADTANGTGVVEGSYDSTSWVLTGKVHIEHQGTVLDANSAKVVFNDRLVRSIEVRDTPASFSHPTKVAGERYRGSAEAISFDGASRRVRFNGRPKFSFGSNEGDSDKPLLYDLDKGVLSSEGNRDAAARVRLTIRPGETPSIMVEGANTSWNFNEGTIQFDQFVLRQAPATLIRADKASGSGVTAGNNDNSRWLLTDQVHVEYQEAVLDADSATVAFAARVMRSVDVRGAPALFSHPSKVAGQSFRGRADQIAFDNEKHEVRFNDHVWYSRDGGAEGVSNKPVIYDLENRKLRSEKAGTAGPGVSLKFPGVNKERVTIPRTPDRGTAR
jgi:lipopolysaccharide export system protein LptA